MCYEHVLDCICFNMPTADSPNPYMCETTDYTLFQNVGLTIVKRTANIILCSWFLSTKKGEARTQSSRTQSYSGIPRLHFDNLATSLTVERGDVYFSLYQKGRGTDTVLSPVQSLGLRINSFNISNLRKTLSSRKYLSPSRKRTATFSSWKKRGVARTQW